MRHGAAFDRFEALAVYESGESNSSSPKKASPAERDINCIVSEYPISQDYQTAKDLFKHIPVKLYENFNETIIFAIMDGKGPDSKVLTELIYKLWDDFPKYFDSFASFIDNKMISIYSEHELDYPCLKDLFGNLILKWIESSETDKIEFVNKLKSKNSSDEDEQYNIQLFNENVTANYLE